MEYEGQHLCQCGCGQTTTRVNRTITLEGMKKGQYRKFIRGHHAKISHPQYKNGTFKHHGYIYVLSPDHPHPTQGKYVKRSRLVMEKKIGRYLLPGEQVHHINNIRDDDDPENLELTTLGKHNNIHGKPKLMIEKRWENVSGTAS